MSDRVIEIAKLKKTAAELKLASYRSNIETLEKQAALAQKDVDQLTMFIAQYERLSKENTETNGDGTRGASSGLRLRRGTIPAAIAELLLRTEDNEMSVNQLATELKNAGAINSDNFVNITYTTLKRRADIFEKTKPGVFKLKTTEFEIDESK